MAAACLGAGRREDAVRLIAVSKRVDLERVAEACRRGQIDLGENRLPEAVDRQAALAHLLSGGGQAGPELRWHFIGHLQSRKVGQAAGRFALLHGVDSVRLAGKISRQCVADSVEQAILLEVNVTGERQKSGLAPAEVVAALGACLELPGLRVSGLMCMARYGAPQAELRATFAALRRLAEQARRELSAPLPELSMGMSDDFEAAIAEGATLVRVGTAIFGSRQP